MRKAIGRFVLKHFPNYLKYLILRYILFFKKEYVIKSINSDLIIEDKKI